MRDGDIDDVLRKAAEAQPAPDPALLDRIAASLQPKMAPVRPLPPAWVLSSTLAGICMAIAVGAAMRSGLHGIDAMDKGQKVVFPALVGLIIAAAGTWVAEMIPGSKQKQTPWKVLSSATFTLWALFPVLFHDHHTENFVHSGIVCFGAGLLYAIPIALAGWWLLRRGFAVDSTGAALAAGTLAGLGGLAMLELHCPNFQVAHLELWHTAVVPVSAALAVLTVKVLWPRFRKRS